MMNHKSIFKVYNIKYILSSQHDEVFSASNWNEWTFCLKSKFRGNSKDIDDITKIQKKGNSKDIYKYKQRIEMIQKYIDYVNSIFIILKIFIL